MAKVTVFYGIDPWDDPFFQTEVDLKFSEKETIMINHAILCSSAWEIGLKDHFANMPLREKIGAYGILKDKSHLPKFTLHECLVIKHAVARSKDGHLNSMLDGNKMVDVETHIKQNNRRRINVMFLQRIENYLQEISNKVFFENSLSVALGERLDA